MGHAESDRLAGYKLLHDASLVLFDVLDTKLESTVDDEEKLVEIELRMRDHEDGEESDEEAAPDECTTVEWGGLGFIFALAVLSFADARPRGYSEREYNAEDDFEVIDLIEHLRYERGMLHFDADYVKGRCMKTDITVRPDGRVTLSTRCRGEAALRWIDKLKGKKLLTAVENAPEA